MFYDLPDPLDQNTKKLRIYLHHRPFKDLNIHTSALGLHKSPCKEINPRKGAPPPQGELAAGDSRPDLANKRHEAPQVLT
jgi:hypothetical protein